MYKIYQVEYGDTIDIIANKTSTTSDNIKKINGFNSDNDLVVGSLIIVPKNNNEYFKTYIVQNGDSIYSIAKLYNIDPNTLLMLNGLNKSDYIYPNQELTIPSDDIDIYITKDGDTIDYIINSFGISAEELNKENEKIYVLEDQLIIHKKDANN